MRLALAAFALLLATTLASPVQALDCTPFQTFDCTNNGYYDVVNGQPGEVLCGIDFTGWTLHVVDVVVTSPGFYAMQAAAGNGQFGVYLDTAILLMDDCTAGTCLDSQVTVAGLTNLVTCLDVGTHKFVVAVNGTAPTASVNMGLQCVSCADGLLAGYSCPMCEAIPTETSDWSSIKRRFDD